MKIGVFLASMALGCSSASAPTSIQDWCADFSQALCERAVSCGAEPNMTTCYNVTNANSGYPAGCGTLTCNPGLVYDQARAEACVSDENAASCADISGNVTPPSCTSICH